MGRVLGCCTIRICSCSQGEVAQGGATTNIPPPHPACLTMLSASSRAISSSSSFRKKSHTSHGQRPGLKRSKSKRKIITEILKGQNNLAPSTIPVCSWLHSASSILGCGNTFAIYTPYMPHTPYSLCLHPISPIPSLVYCVGAVAGRARRGMDNGDSWDLLEGKSSTFQGQGSDGGQHPASSSGHKNIITASAPTF